MLEIYHILYMWCSLGLRDPRTKTGWSRTERFGPGPSSVKFQISDRTRTSKKWNFGPDRTGPLPIKIQNIGLGGSVWAWPGPKSFSNLWPDLTRTTKNLKISDQFGPIGPWIPDQTNKCIGGHVSEVYFKLLIDHAVFDRVHTWRKIQRPDVE